MIWHEWESVNLETVHNSQLLSWSLRSEKKKYLVYLLYLTTNLID